MIPKNLPSNLCGWLQLQVPDVYINTPDNPIVTIRCNYEAMKLLLETFNTLIEKLVTNKEPYIGVGWIAYNIGLQLDVQLTEPTPSTGWSLDALRVFKNRIPNLSEQETKDIDYLINELQQDVASLKVLIDAA